MSLGHTFRSFRELPPVKLTRNKPMPTSDAVAVASFARIAIGAEGAAP